MVFKRYPTAGEKISEMSTEYGISIADATVMYFQILSAAIEMVMPSE